MFGLTEITELSELSNNLYQNYHYGIVPTVLLPLAFLGTGISVVATFVAGLFGVKLKAEGPRKLLELLLKPKILISAMLLNIVFYFGYMGYEHLKNGPVPNSVQKFLNRDISFSKDPLANEKALWSQKVEKQGVFASGAEIGDELFVGTDEGNLFVLDKNSGKIKNKIFFGKFLSPTPTKFKDYLYFGEGLHQSHGMHVYKFNPRTKTIENSFQTNGHTEIFPVFTTYKNKDYLLQSAGADGLYAIDPESMEKLWQFKDGHMDAFALSFNGAAYIGSGIPEEEIGKHRPYAYKVNIENGELIWKKELPLSAWYGPVVIESDICFIQGEIHVQSEVGGLACFDEAGNRVKEVSINMPVISKPIVKNGIIYFNDYHGSVYAWNYHQNKILWKVDSVIKKGSYSSIQFYNDHELISTIRSGGARIIDLESGKIRSEVEFTKDEVIYADPLVLKDSFYIFGMKGHIFKSEKI